MNVFQRNSNGEKDNCSVCACQSSTEKRQDDSRKINLIPCIDVYCGEAKEDSCIKTFMRNQSEEVRG